VALSLPLKNVFVISFVSDITVILTRKYLNIDPEGIYYMNLECLKKYIYIIQKPYRKSSEIDSVSLDILEHFAWENCLSAYNIYSKLKSTRLEMAYKNVNKRVYTLLSTDLVQKVEINDDNSNKHNAKYYKLTEYGIFQLFLKKREAILINQLDARKYSKISVNTVTFLHNYRNIMLFECFIYPYFEKDTLFAAGNYLLWDLYRYLTNCCGRIEQQIKYSDIPVHHTIFLWNEVPGKDNKKLLQHLKEIFNLKNLDSSSLEKNDDTTITVKTSSAYILLRLDKNKKKVIAMSTINDQYKEFGYEISQIGSDILVSKPKAYEEDLKDIVNDTKQQIEQLIYGFVSELASAANSERSKEISYYGKILSEDKKFMSTVKEIYENRHKGFEQGYRMLRNYNR
jgi:hypothetical protein